MTYCYECEDPVMGGVVPTTCDCIECICPYCWDQYLKNPDWDHCPECSTKFEKDSWKLYDKFANCELLDIINFDKKC